MFGKHLIWAIIFIVSVIGQGIHFPCPWFHSHFVFPVVVFCGSSTHSVPFLVTSARDVCKLSPIILWYCISACVIILEKYHRPRWCVCLAWWYQLLLLTRYVICSGQGIWVIVRTQKGIVLQIIPYTWEYFGFGHHNESNILEPLGVVAIVSLCVCPV